MRETVAANGCIILYRAMLQMTQRLALLKMGDIMIEDVPKNQNFLIMHSLLVHYAKIEPVDPCILGFLATFPNNPNILYEMDTVKWEEFEAMTTATDKYWCYLIDKLEKVFKK